MGRRIAGRTAAADDEDAGEDHQGREDFLPCQRIHSDADADDCSNYWLDIAVHADKGRAYPLLTERDEEIAHEGRADYQKSKFPKLYSRDMYP